MAGGGNAQIDLAFDKSLEQMNAIGITPLHNKFNITGAQIIAPGDPQRSILLHRMAIRSSGQMPQLATNIVDARAVAMLRDWILSLPPNDRSDEMFGDQAKKD